jgi:sulfonate dioxygenase
VYPYPDLKPAFPKDIITAPYEPIYNVVDRGTFADPAYPHLHLSARWQKMAVNIGTELKSLDGDESLQLNNFSTEQRDELARLVAERGVVVLRDQKLTPEELIKFGSYYGAKERPLHQHPSSGVPRRRGLDNIHVVWHDEHMRPSDSAFTSTELWHCDMSQEINSLGLTALYNITNPVNGGGDTLFSSGYGLYDALSPAMQVYLESLSALHSGVEQANGAKSAGTHVRRDPVESVHPLVRTHPVTGWKSVFVNPAFTKSIVGVPKLESDRILQMLYDLMATHPDLTLRVRWQTNTIVLWDNRIVSHSATYDHYRPDPTCRRHALRVASTAEIPSQTLPNGQPGRSRKEDIWAEQGLDVEAMRAIGRSARKGGFKD